jgi:AAA ATPase domain
MTKLDDLVKEFPITEVSVKGFKSFAEEQRIKIRPLTILAGANSSGKSSAMQPLLLLKQTLEASYDPGPLLLYGPHVQFTSVEQLLTRLGGSRGNTEFGVKVFVNNIPLQDLFQRHRRRCLDRGESRLDPLHGRVHPMPGGSQRHGRGLPPDRLQP